MTQLRLQLRYLLCRTNLAFAALTMNDDINITSFEYGLGSGLFFFLGCAQSSPAHCHTASFSSAEM